MSTPAQHLLFETPGEETFLAAWKKAVQLSGVPALFGVRAPGDLERARCKDSLSPQIKEIARKIAEYPKSRAAWIVLLVQLYNPDQGAKLADKIGARGLGDLVLLLSREQRNVLVDLVFYYTGW